MLRFFEISYNADTIRDQNIGFNTELDESFLNKFRSFQGRERVARKRKHLASLVVGSYIF